VWRLAFTCAVAIAGFSRSSVAEDEVSGRSSNSLQFAIRADPSEAKAINHLLTQVALPSEEPLAGGMSVSDFLQGRCGTGLSTPATQSAVRRKEHDKDIIEFTPCIRFRTAVVEVQANDTLAAIATRLGVSKANTSRFVRLRGAPPNWKRLGGNENVRRGDTVVVPEVPEWTVFNADQSKVSDIHDLVVRLSRVLNCGAEEPYKCIVGRGVIAFQRRVPQSPDNKDATRPSTQPELHLVPGVPGDGQFALPTNFESAFRLRVPPTCAAPFPSAAAPTSSVTVPVPSCAAAEASVVADAPNVAAIAPSGDSTEPAPPTLVEWHVAGRSDLLSAAPVETHLTTAENASVALNQWPYDFELVKSALIAELNLHPGRTPTPTIIGVADGGLASSDGKPLPPTAFTTIRGEPIYGYSGDLIGAGVDRVGEHKSGDVGLCPPEYDSNNVSTWPQTSFQLASHGTVVASIATGLPLRTEATLQSVLPALTFFRLSTFSTLDCSKKPEFISSQPIDAFDAIRYLNTRAFVINVSYVDTSDDPFFPYALKTELSVSGSNRLLTVPAGNDGVDLDEMHQCPPCLANADWPPYDAVIGRRVLVIGAATRDRQTANFSGSGAKTVYLYAPAVPVGAVDILGKDASGFPPATSYAAPYVAMAAALLHSLGMNDLMDIAHRLRAASWPVVEGDKESSPFSHVVIDLAKVAALHNYAIEVIDHDAAGSSVRRTYIGKLDRKLDQISICAGVQFSEATVQAVRVHSGNHMLFSHG
jgi:Subtilase family